MDAHLLVTRLEGSGIPAFARDEHMVTLDWMASNAIGGVKVDVADEDYDRALAILREGENLTVAPTVKTPRRGMLRYVAIGCATAMIAALAYGALQPGAWDFERVVPIVLLSLAIGAMAAGFVALRDQ